MEKIIRFDDQSGEKPEGCGGEENKIIRVPIVGPDRRPNSDKNEGRVSVVRRIVVVPQKDKDEK